MRAWRVLLVAVALVGSGCAGLSPRAAAEVGRIVEAARGQDDSCPQDGTCAQPSALHDLGGKALAEGTAVAPRHYALLLDYGQDALLARLNLIRSATTTLDVQTYIFDEDDAGRLVLDELIAAARRGVRVRLLVDQLSALKRVETLAALAGVHRNFEMRIYNPVLGRAHISYPLYVVAAACCWHRLNQRMHSKLLLVDGAIGVTGGRNYQNDYYDWDDAYNFRDRDVLVAGPVAREMGANFQRFWDAPLARRIEALRDVAAYLRRNGVPQLAAHDYEVPARAKAISEDANDAALVREKLVETAHPVGAVHFLADLPDKHDAPATPRVGEATPDLRQIIESTQRQLILQTPYLVLSKPAQRLFRAMHRRASPPDVVVSTNSLAATDSFLPYAIAYKYKRRYLRDFGFRIYEFKPFPQDAPFDLEATGVDAAGALRRETQARAPLPSSGDAAAVPGEPRIETPVAGARTPRRTPLAREYAALRWAGLRVNQRVPLKRAGVRLGLHAKSLVVDGRIGVVGTHNFDPRGDHYNTESAVVIEDADFARALAASIERDMAPENAWTIAPRHKSPILPGIEYNLAKLSERLPIFDLWPTRYATSYEFVPGPRCKAPLPQPDPRFHECYRAVGDFPEVNLSLKMLLTRIFTAFGSGLAPIL